MDKMDNLRITQYGKPLDESDYSIDLEHKVFTSDEGDLVLDFSICYKWTFKTGGNCIFSTGNDCIFTTSYGCTFKTGYNCTFKTGNDCIFTTSYGCTFNTGHHCTFKTGGDCTFKTGNSCTFSLWDINTCKFKSYDENSVILDRKDSEAYKLTKEFVKLQKIVNG